MTTTTLILFKCENPDFGTRYIQTDETYPTPERALEIFKNELKNTTKGKESPNLIENSSVNDEPLILDGVVLNEERIMRLI